MNIELTELIIGQAKAFVVMLAAGVLTESLWQIKVRLQRRIKSLVGKRLTEVLFWVAAAIVLSRFLYYSSYGRISVHSLIGFLLGLLLWKKIIMYVILCPWERNDEAQNLKTTARSSIWRKREGSGWRKDRRRKKRKKRR